MSTSSSNGSIQASKNNNGSMMTDMRMDDLLNVTKIVKNGDFVIANKSTRGTNDHIIAGHGTDMTGPRLEDVTTPEDSIPTEGDVVIRSLTPSGYGGRLRLPAETSSRRARLPSQYHIINKRPYRPRHYYKLRHGTRHPWRWWRDEYYRPMGVYDRSVYYEPIVLPIDMGPAPEISDEKMNGTGMPVILISLAVIMILLMQKKSNK